MKTSHGHSHKFQQNNSDTGGPHWKQVYYCVYILSKYYIYMCISLFAYALYINSFIGMYYNVLPNKFTHSLTHSDESCVMRNYVPCELHFL